MATAPEVTTADLSDTDSTTALFQGAIGPVNTTKYLPLFSRFDAADRTGPSWNWAAALCTLNWMVFRQLWTVALAYLGAVMGVILLVFGIGRLVFQFSEGVELGLLLGFAVAAFAVPGLYGNALLYSACRKKMAAALAAKDTLPEACVWLARRAPTRLRLMLLALANVLVLGIALAGYFEFPLAGALPKFLAKTTEAPAATPTASAAPSAAPVDPASPAVAPAPAAPAAALPVAPAEGASASAPVPVPVPVPMPTSPTPAATPANAPAASAPVPAPASSSPVTSAAAPALGSTQPAASSAAPGAVSATPASTPASEPAVAPPTAAMPAPAQVAAPEPAPAATKSASAKPKPSKTKPAVAPVASTPKAAANATATKTTRAAKETAKETLFYVNAGLFADSNNALNAYVKLTDAGLAASKLEFNTSKGKRTRVRVGPFDTEAKAEAAMEKVRALGLDAIILRPE